MYKVKVILSQNYICHLGVYSANAIKAVNGFRVGYEGSQDYDLALRIIQKFGWKQVKFIDKEKRPTSHNLSTQSAQHTIYRFICRKWGFFKSYKI